MNNGSAVVSVENEVCMGCFMNIPPQLYIEVQSLFKLNREEEEEEEEPLSCRFVSLVCCNKVAIGLQ